MRFRKTTLARNPAAARMAAELQGVTVEHLLDTIAKRKKYREAKMYRARSRKRSLARNRFAPKTIVIDAQHRYAGEGDLDVYLRMAGLNQKQFCEWIDLNKSSFQRWYGHPLHKWPLLLLHYYLWSQRMLEKLGPAGLALEPNPDVPLLKVGRYPRKRGDLTIQHPEKRTIW